MNYTFYRSKLSAVQQKAYDHLVTAIRNLEPRVRLPYLNKTQLSKTSSAVHRDHPEFFYVKWNDRYYYDYEDHLEYTLQYDITKEAAEQILRKTEEIADKLIEYAKKAGCKTKLAIAAYLHDYLTDNISYTEGKRSPKRHHCMIGPLVNKECVCEGYAKAYLYMLDRAGIESILVIGKTEPESDTGHVWNMVRIENGWYHVDTTWDSNGKGAKGDWTYFMLTSEEITKKSHILPTDVSLPKCGQPLTLKRDIRQIN